ncbi:MAG: ferrochelatase [Epsilonproteobacteria bacterium]|nr:ferrochelatase [Campylobacterota bacterium]
MADHAVILMNMGGVSELNEVEVFMRNMFNDPRIIGAPPWIRRPLAEWITRMRLEGVKENYKRLGGGSPLLDISRRIAQKLEARIGVPVELAMRYTPPFAREALARLKEAGVGTIYLIPMYPQFSTTTTASSIEDIRATALKMGYFPKFVSLLHYYDSPLWLEAVEERIVEALEGERADDMTLIFSAHGLPQRMVDKKDPYQKQVEAEVRLHEERLRKRGVVFEEVRLAYQSRVGPMAWLRPSLEETLEGLNSRRVLIYPISFTVDNSETLFELAMEYKEVAQKLGYQTYRVCCCPNDSDTFIKTLEGLYRRLTGQGEG